MPTKHSHTILTTQSNTPSKRLGFTFLSSIDAINKQVWEELCGHDYPFLRYDFIAALEHSGCTSAESGWQPHHLVIRTSDDTIVGVMPLYLKTHSYGEYVFDWSWADAYHRHGFHYYPKLLCAIPYTPATGPRLCLAPDLNNDDVVPSLVEALNKHCETLEASSWHCLFPQAELNQQLAKAGVAARNGCQFHWLNQDFVDFEDFLSTFNSRKRKNLNKERRKVIEQGINIVIKECADISKEEWHQFYQFYHLTYYKRSGRQGYLNQQFFLTIAKSIPEHIVMVQAYHNQQLVAAALCFKDSHTLYGRYWGCAEEFDMLHFECCYYQGIEYAISHKLQRFDPGAQGEHKIQRGFTPILTYSNHWIANPEFRQAINEFLRKEIPSNKAYIDDATTYLPFKQSTE